MFLIGTNKDSEELQRMELGMIDKLHHPEEALNRLSNVLLANPKNQKVPMVLTTLKGGQPMVAPQSLKEVINLARMRDDQLTRQRRFMRLPPVRAPIALPQATRVAPATPAKPIKRLSWEEMQRKRAQGHRCQNRSSYSWRGMRVTCIVGTILINKRWKMTMVERMDITENHAVIAKMGPHEVMVLIDSGSTHNFISNRLANMLRLPVIPTETFPVRVPNSTSPFSLSLSVLILSSVFNGLKCWDLWFVIGKQLTMDFIWDLVYGPSRIVVAYQSSQLLDP
ncbi:hypothetical protein AAG906_024595 [Vitis piasezkii]